MENKEIRETLEEDELAREIDGDFADECSCCCCESEEECSLE